MRLSLALHELGPERALCRVLVVRAAAQAHPVDGSPPASRHFFDVIELQPGPRGAAVAARADERALAAIALPDGSLHMVRDVPG